MNSDDQTRARIEQSAKLELRAVLLADAATNTAVNPSESPSPTEPAEELESTPTIEPTDGSDPAWITPALQDQFDNFDCSELDETSTSAAPADEPLVTCDVERSAKYLLGPVEASGENIADATNGMVQTSTGATTGQWAVNIVFDEEGTQDFTEVSTRLFGLQGQTPRDQFAFVLDGAVLTAPSMNAAITDGRPQITGQLHAGDLEVARRPAEVRRAADQLHGGVVRHDLGDARYLAAAVRPHRRPHRPHPRRDLLAVPVPGARVGHDRFARDRRPHHLPDDHDPVVA